MIIDKVRVENYRSLEKAFLDLGDLTAIVGKNGAGKSTMLYALESFFNPGHIYSKNDYHNHDTQNISITIEVTFSRLRQAELDAFGNYVSNGKLTVAKVISLGGTRYFGSIPQIEQFAAIRSLSGKAKNDAYKALRESGELADLPSASSAAAVDAACDAYEVAHPDLLKPMLRERQFLGAKNIGGGMLDNFTRFILVPAIRDVSNEDKKGVIANLIELIVERRLNAREDFIKFKADVAGMAEGLFHPDKLTELKDFGDAVTAKLTRYAPGAELTVDFDQLVPPDIRLPAAVVSVSDDHLKVPIRYTGHGLQRALILALLELLAQTPTVTPTVKVDPEAAGEPENPEGAPRPLDLILAIEEPELYLHPNRSRLMASVLRSLSKPGDDPLLPQTQVMYVTHSPYFVDIQRFDDVRVARKRLAKDRCGSTFYVPFARLTASRRLAEIKGDDPAAYTAESFAVRSGQMLNALVNEGFFADAVVVVEGTSDVSALMAMQSALGKKWEERGVVIVSANGKNNIDRLVICFAGFGIPTYFLFDGDGHKKLGKKDADARNIRNASLIKLGEVGAIAAPVPTTVSAGFACFLGDLEAELEAAIGTDAFQARRLEAVEACGLYDVDKPLKNSEVMRLMIEGIYGSGQTVPVLEEIVGRIETLLSA